LCHYRDPQPSPTSELFSIIDNIKVPEHIINLFKFMMKTHPAKTSGNCGCRNEKITMFFDMVKHLKNSTKEMYSESTQNIITKIKAQVESYKSKNTLLESELEKINKKIKNLQTSYEEAMNDNEQIKQENKSLKETIERLQHVGRRARPGGVVDSSFRDESGLSLLERVELLQENYRLQEKNKNNTFTPQNLELATGEPATGEPATGETLETD